MIASLLLLAGASGWTGLPLVHPGTAVRPSLAASPCVRRSKPIVLKDDPPSAILIGSAMTIGIITGIAVAGFKTSIAAVVATCYSGDSVVEYWADRRLGASAVFIPALGGAAVAALRAWSPRQNLGPSLAEHVAEVERAVDFKPESQARRSIAAVATLGTGAALGPEGPSVELGVAVSRFVGGAAAQVYGGSGGAIRSPLIRDPEAASLRRQRQLVAAGAAAGVAAGFNAPLTGVFFALEIVSEAVRSSVVVDPDDENTANAIFVADANAELTALSRRDTAELDIKSKEAISATVISALIASFVVQEILGDELSLRPGVYTLGSPAVELPLYIGLGVAAGGVALLFEQTTAASRSVFNSIGAAPPSPSPPPSSGNDIVPTPIAPAGWVIDASRPILGGLICGLIGLAFPQILFFGYSTLNAILEAGDTTGAAESANVVGSLAGGLSGGVATEELLESLGGINLLVLLFAKLLATSICIGSGLVGGTFAPSLFFGAVLGASYQAFAGGLLEQLADAIAAYQTSINVPVGSWGVIPQLTVADAPAYALVGAAATLASVFRAPLTASLLFLEQTRGQGYDIVLPLLAACGTGPLVVDFARGRFKPSTSSSPSPRPADKTPAVTLVRPDPEDCDTDVPVEEVDVCDVDPYVVLPDECDVDNRVAFCFDEDGAAEGSDAQGDGDDATTIASAPPTEEATGTRDTTR